MIENDIDKDVQHREGTDRHIPRNLVEVCDLFLFRENMNSLRPVEFSKIKFKNKGVFPFSVCSLTKLLLIFG